MTARLALAALVVAAIALLARRFRVEPLGPATLDDVDWLREWRYT